MISLFAALLTAVALGGASEPSLPSPLELVRASALLHDPGASWAGGAFLFELRIESAAGVVQFQSVLVDNRRGRYRVEEVIDGRLESAVLEADGSCRLLVDGVEVDDRAALEARGFSCAALAGRRDYHRFLWGQPMNLLAAGALEGATVRRGLFRGAPVVTLRREFVPPEGEDSWYFHFEPTSHRFVGTEFYKDEAKRLGEYITLEGETVGAGLRLPRRRTWYQSWDDAPVSTDLLLFVRAVP